MEESVSELKTIDELDTTSECEVHPKGDTQNPESTNQDTEPTGKMGETEIQQQEQQTEPTTEKNKTTTTESETHMCWICYSDDRSEELISPCQCKGTMQYAHQSCLQEWLQQSSTKTCPHCSHTYKVETEYESVWYQWLDHPRVPYIVAAMIIAVFFFVFHLGFSYVLQIIQKRRMKQSSQQASTNNVASMMHRPEMIGLLRTALPMFHPAFSLVINGIQPNATATASMSSWSFTMLFAEFELFAVFMAVLFSLSHYVYKWYTGRTTNDDTNHTSFTPPSTLNDDIHEGLATDSIDSHDGDVDSDDEWSEDSDADHNSDETIWDVANRFWSDTNIGGRQNLSEEAVYLFPFDVIQTAFYTLHYYGKQQQNKYINKTINIQSTELLN